MVILERICLVLIGGSGWLVRESYAEYMLLRIEVTPKVLLRKHVIKSQDKP